MKGALATGALSLSGLDTLVRAARPARIIDLQKPSVGEQQLADTILAYARSQGAAYCDVRIVRYLDQSVNARNNIITGISDSESYGIGIRVIKNNTWGYAATRSVTEESAKRAADEAIRTAMANTKLQSIPLDLVPVEAVTAEWKTPIKKNPFDVSFKDRGAFLLDLHSKALALAAGGKKLHVTSHLGSVREEKYFASSEGSKIWQECTRINPSTWITATDVRTGEFASRALFVLPQGRGYEYVEQYPYDEEIRQAVAEATEKITAASVEPGEYDLVLHPTHLWLTIHESIGHPTELDRILGYEANFAGTSFLQVKNLNRFTYGSYNVTIVADRTQEGGLATAGYDDDGCPSEEYTLIDQGELVGLQTTREQAKAIGESKSRAQSYGQGWWGVPFQRMPNISLKPNKLKMPLADLINDTENGIFIKGNSSYSIDQQRFNFQFTGQVAYEIKEGKLGRMLRDVAYQSTSQEFWKSCNGVCDASEYMIGGSMNDGKGEPMQSNPVSHGCPPARFKNINVINTRTQSANARGGMLDYNE